MFPPHRCTANFIATLVNCSDHLSAHCHNYHFNLFAASWKGDQDPGASALRGRGHFSCHLKLPTVTFAAGQIYEVQQHLRRFCCSDILIHNGNTMLNHNPVPPPFLRCESLIILSFYSAVFFVEITLHIIDRPRGSASTKVREENFIRLNHNCYIANNIHCLRRSQVDWGPKIVCC